MQLPNCRDVQEYEALQAKPSYTLTSADRQRLDELQQQLENAQAELQRTQAAAQQAQEEAAEAHRRAEMAVASAAAIPVSCH